MSTIYLIRHGQASFGADNYDVLSETGVTQARALGSYFATRSLHFDAVYSGPRKRQLDTTKHMLQAALHEGREYPEPLTMSELDEYPAFELLNHWIPILSASDPTFQEIVSQPLATAGGDRIEKAFQMILGRWANGELDTGDLESFEEFAARVERGLEDIMTTQGRKKSIAVVTSGGPISIAMRLALDLHPVKTIDLGRSIINSSVSQFRYRSADDGISLLDFNTLAHISDANLITYR